MNPDPLHVPADASETVWVFALDLPPAEAEAVVEGGPGSDWPLKELMGAGSLRARHIEAFPASDLAGVGLPGYLVEGLGIDVQDVEQDRVKLEASDRHIVIASARAFDGEEQRLSPRLPLRHLGTYSQIQTEQRLVPLPGAKSEAEIPPTPGVAPAPQVTPRGGRGIIGLVAAAIVVLILAWFLSGSAR